MDNLITIDYSKFGYRELEIAGKLLALYAEGGVDFLGDGLTVNFNTQSGYVFLSDEDFNVGMLNDTETKIIQFFSCFECDYEATQEDALVEGKDFVTYGGFCSKDCAFKNAGNGQFTGFINDYLDNANRQIQTGEDPQKFGIPNTQPSLVGGIVGSLWKFILQGVLFFITLLFFVVGFLFIAFQAVIRFASLLFLSVLFPVAIPFALSEKTEGITNTYFKTWFTFLIHQPAFVLGYAITIQIFNTILNQQGASIGMLFLYTGFLFFLGGVNVMVARIFGDSWTALSANLAGAVLGGTVTGAGMSTTREVKRGMFGGPVTGARSWMGRSISRKLGFLTTNKKDDNSQEGESRNKRSTTHYTNGAGNGISNGYGKQKGNYNPEYRRENYQDSRSIRIGHAKQTEEGYQFTDAKTGGTKLYPHNGQPDNTSKIKRDLELSKENFIKPKSSVNRFQGEIKNSPKKTSNFEGMRTPIKRKTKQTQTI